ncbi:MAG: hypothetical protein ACT4N8_16290 [Sphingosinicella sp.]|uniref:hypothetical protein n=1 Tax=Sphingosinicella sp. TaxID=1917971 RepID=UPI0040382885
MTFTTMRNLAAATLAGALLAGLAAPASAGRYAAADTAKANRPAQRPAPRATAPDPNREICLVTRLTGSRLQRRICKTAEEWEAAGGLPTDED